MWRAAPARITQRYSLALERVSRYSGLSKWDIFSWPPSATVHRMLPCGLIYMPIGNTHLRHIRVPIDIITIQTTAEQAEIRSRIREILSNVCISPCSRKIQGSTKLGGVLCLLQLQRTNGSPQQRPSQCYTTRDNCTRRGFVPSFCHLFPVHVCRVVPVRTLLYEPLLCWPFNIVSVAIAHWRAWLSDPMIYSYLQWPRYLLLYWLLLWNKTGLEFSFRVLAWV